MEMVEEVAMVASPLCHHAPMAHVLLAQMDRSLIAALSHQYAQAEVSLFARMAAIHSLQAGNCRGTMAMTATDMATTMIVKTDWQFGRSLL
jgi:acyl-coenzyme A thioesterase PaaI-like protein